jgi:hypothetical protein
MPVELVEMMNGDRESAPEFNRERRFSCAAGANDEDAPDGYAPSFRRIARSL